MTKVKKTLIYYFGAFIAFLFRYSVVQAQPLSFEIGYGNFEVAKVPEQTFLKKTISIIVSPITIIIFVILAMTIGIIVFIKHKKNIKKKPQQEI